ncbi:MAG: toll/interleukin-1 receptor domain-containing protein [Clostridia bacterium]|nr:toll/interleukin-1 receptor domain-containing protein [Clostridia bacterium]
MRYLAFISYRHRERDRRISALLRRGLENHHLPAGCPLDRKRRVFRDTDELPTSTDLGADIQNALRDSGWLIPLCSEEYMKSRWCLREIEDWIARGRRDHILPVLLSGTPDTAMPESIRDLEPAGDLRGVEGRDLRRAADALVSRLLSRMSGTAEGKVAAAERAFRLIRAVSVSACLAAAVFGFGLYTLRTADMIARNNESIRAATEAALREKELALRERNNALEKTAAYYTDRAWDAVNADRPLEAARLALQGLPEDPEGDAPVSLSAVSALRVALTLPGRTRDDYVLIHAVTPGMTVTGFDPVEVGLSSEHEGADELILNGGNDEKYRLILSTGEITDYNGDLLALAREMGYSRAQKILNNSRDTVYYGREKQMFNDRYGTVLYTLNGEPFYADRIVQEAGGKYMLAWLEDPLPGQERRAAVFRLPSMSMNVPLDGAEALCAIPMEGGIRAAVFPFRGTSVAVLDTAGTLRLYDVNTGRLKRTIEGAWRAAAGIKDTSSALLLTDAEGNGCLMDLMTGEEVYRLESPGRIREIWYCEKKSCLMACCDDGIRLYNFSDGRLLRETLTPSAPLAAQWGGYDPYMFLHEGNKIALLFDDTIDISALKKDVDPLLPGARTLDLPGGENRIRTAFFSADGKYLFLQSATGDLSKWDTRTGSMLWVREADWERAPSQMPSSCLSVDGGAVWRGSRDGSGYERIDPETGETLWVNQVVSGTTLGSLLESPDGALALHVTSGGDACAFDTASGAVLWKRDGLSENCFFSPDGKEITFIRHRGDKKADREWTALTRLEAYTGGSLEERVLQEGQYVYVNTAFDRENRLFVLLKKDERAAYVISLPEGDITPYALPDAVYTDQIICLPDISYEGKPCIEWSDTARGSFIMELLPDGTVGPVLTADSPQGRRLRIGAGSLTVYRGQEACFVSQKTPEGWTKRIERTEDGACLLEIRQGEAFSFVLSPDQESLCVTYDSRPPVLMPLTDTAGLIRQARELTGGMSE